MRAAEVPLLNVETLEQPLGYDHAVDAAIFLGALGRAPSRTEQLAAAYYLQHRTQQITKNLALTGDQVAERVEEMIESVKDPGFLSLLVNQYHTAQQPEESLIKYLKESTLARRQRQPRVGQVLKQAVIFSPIAFLVSYEGMPDAMQALGEPQPVSQRVVSLVGGSLLAGYLTSRVNQHKNSKQQSS